MSGPAPQLGGKSLTHFVDVDDPLEELHTRRDGPDAQLQGHEARCVGRGQRAPEAHLAVGRGHLMQATCLPRLPTVHPGTRREKGSRWKSGDGERDSTLETPKDRGHIPGITARGSPSLVPAVGQHGPIWGLFVGVCIWGEPWPVPAPAFRGRANYNHPTRFSPPGLQTPKLQCNGLPALPCNLCTWSVGCRGAGGPGATSAIRPGLTHSS